MEHRSVLRALGGPRACRGQRGEKGRGGPAFFRVYSYIYIGIIFTYIYISIYIYIYKQMYNKYIFRKDNMYV